MAKRKVLVFGAAGFIGTYLIDELVKQGWEVTASDISEFGEKYYAEINVPYVYIDITKSSDFSKLGQKKYDVVINLAALQPANFASKKYVPGDYININVVGSLNIFEFACASGSGQIIYACSHRNTSGLWYKKQAIKEEDGRAQEYKGEYSMFSISESAAQDCLEFYRANYPIKGIIFRLPPVYGFGPHLEIFKDGKQIKTGFQTFIDNAMACKPLEVWGDSNKGRDIIYVKDVVAAFLLAMENESAGGLYNITTGRYLSLKEEVETIAKVFWGDNSKPIIIEKPEHALLMDSFVYDNSKAKRELGWTPKYSFEELLRDYKKEKEANRFAFLLEKRQKMFKEGQ
jgi:UDP-glucose 4-epimerase